MPPTGCVCYNRLYHLYILHYTFSDKSTAQWQMMCRRNALGICRVMGTRRNVAKLWRKYRNNAIYAKLKNVLYIFCYCTSRLKPLWPFCGFQLISMMQNKIIIKWLFFPLHLHCRIVYGITLRTSYCTLCIQNSALPIRICTDPNLLAGSGYDPVVCKKVVQNL